MKSIEEFLSRLSPSQLSASFTTPQPNHDASLPEAVRQAANRGWQVFPVSHFARFAGNPGLLMNEATSDVSRLENFAAQYPLCDWRVDLGPSSLCVLEMCGRRSRYSLAALSHDEEECLTIRVQRGDTERAFFRWPEGLVMRASARKLVEGARMLGPGDSCAIPPSGGSHYINPWAEIEAIPHWLRELAFENPDRPPERSIPRPAQSPHPHPCRSPRPLNVTPSCSRKGYPGQSQSGFRKGYRIHRRL